MHKDFSIKNTIRLLLMYQKKFFLIHCLLKNRIYYKDGIIKRKRDLLGFFQGQHHAVRDEFPAAVGCPNGGKLQCAYTAVLR